MSGRKRTNGIGRSQPPSPSSSDRSRYSNRKRTTADRASSLDSTDRTSPKLNQLPRRRSPIATIFDWRRRLRGFCLVTSVALCNFVTIVSYCVKDIIVILMFSGDSTHRSAAGGRRRSTFASDPPFGEIAERILKVVPFVPLQQGKGETYSTAAHRIIFIKYTETNPALFNTESSKTAETDSPANVAVDDQSPRVNDRRLDDTQDELLTAVSELTGWKNCLHPFSSTSPGGWALDNESRSLLTMHNEFVFRSPYRPNFSRAQSPLSSSPASSVGTQPFSLDLRDESFGNEYNLYSIIEELHPLVGSPPNSPPPSPIDDFNRRTPPTGNATSLILF